MRWWFAIYCFFCFFFGFLFASWVAADAYIQRTKKRPGGRQ